MTTTIAVTGKGGVGKTTVAAMTIKYLASSGGGAVLAIDADPSSNLNMVLGLDLEWTVADIRAKREIIDRKQARWGEVKGDKLSIGGEGMKGFYDKNKSHMSFIVTGSARLDYYRKGGDSLLGRYHYYRLHPFLLNPFLWCYQP